MYTVRSAPSQSVLMLTASVDRCSTSTEGYVITVGALTGMHSRLTGRHRRVATLERAAFLRERRGAQSARHASERFRRRHPRAENARGCLGSIGARRILALTNGIVVPSLLMIS